MRAFLRNGAGDVVKQEETMSDTQSSNTQSIAMPEGVDIRGAITPAVREVLDAPALEFLAGLQREFGARRKAILALRQERQEAIFRGELPDYLESTTGVRRAEWSVAPAPASINDRRVEITGPVERKMMINALNSGAKVFLTDFEDALSPTWENVIQGQINVSDAVRGTIAYTSPEGKEYALKGDPAVMILRPRGWHLVEKHLWIDGEPISASLFDFGLIFFRNAAEQLARGTGPYFYLPKLEGHLEARLWNDIFVWAQEKVGIPQGSVRATVLIETILGALEMEEILFELREHASGLNAGRWDYIFSVIKKFHRIDRFVLPDRAQITMTVPFMRSYSEKLVQCCHKHGAHAIGGMAAFIPNRRDAAVTENALAKVREDKVRESGDGYDGTWVAHPDLVPMVKQIFDDVLGERPNQKDRLRNDVDVQGYELLDTRVPGGAITEAGLRGNISVALQYLNAWLNGNGAAAINNLMEDAATAEISRAQIWQWIYHQAQLVDGRTVTRMLYTSMREEELEKLGGRSRERYGDAAEILDKLILTDEFVEFLTLIAYDYLD